MIRNNRLRSRAGGNRSRQGRYQLDRQNDTCMAKNPIHSSIELLTGRMGPEELFLTLVFRDNGDTKP